MFQPTHPHGVRPVFIGLYPCPLSFNPRTRTGCDFLCFKDIMPDVVSTHAPARGATAHTGLTFQA